MKAHTARKVLCNDKVAQSVANSENASVAKVKKEAKNLLTRLNKRERARRKYNA